MKISLRGLCLLLATCVASPQYSHAEFRSAKDIQQECRVAMDVVQKKLPN